MIRCINKEEPWLVWDGTWTSVSCIVKPEPSSPTCKSLVFVSLHKHDRNTTACTSTKNWCWMEMMSAESSNRNRIPGLLAIFVSMHACVCVSESNKWEVWCGGNSSFHPHHPLAHRILAIMCGCVSEHDMQRYEMKAVSFYNIVCLSVSGIRCWAVLAPVNLNNSAKRQRNKNKKIP